VQSVFETWLNTVDRTTLTDLVRRAKGAAAIEVIDWSYTTIRSRPASTGTRNVYRFTGTASHGEKLAQWSLILKIWDVSKQAHEPMVGKRELLAYRSGIFHRLPGGLRTPRCLATSGHGGGTLAWLWLEDIAAPCSAAWPLRRCGLAAYHLGRFNGDYLVNQALPNWPWLNHHWTRTWIEHAAATIERLRDLAKHPLVAQVYSESLLDGMLRLWAERHTFLDVLEGLPHTLCHHDAFPRNLLAQHDAEGRWQTVAIDWALLGIGAVGEEIAPLVAEVEPGRGHRLDALVFHAYLNGLRTAGWRGDPRHARFGYTATAALRYGLGATGTILHIILHDSQPTAAEHTRGLATAHTMRHLAATQGFLLGLAHEARELIPFL
jgi:hypothetical protein